MTDDFKNYLKSYEKSGKGAEKKQRRNSTKATLLSILLGGFVISCIMPPLFLLWVPYLIFLFFYAQREWMG